MDALGRRRGRPAVALLLLLIALVIVGTLPTSAFAGAASSRPLDPVARWSGGSQFHMDARFTATYRHRGWLQSYGIVKVTNTSRRQLHVTCTIFVRTGLTIVADTNVDLSIPGRRTRTAEWGAEGGDERGKVSGIFKCVAM